MYKNCKCKLCGDEYETVNQIISECIKLTEKECKTRNNWVGKVIHLELYWRLKFYHTYKWYMHKSESIQGNETHKILLNFEISTDPPIPVRRPDLALINKKRTRFPVDFVIPVDNRKRKHGPILRSC